MERGVEIARVWSFSDEFSEAPYVVTRGSNGGWKCNCPQCRIRHRSCKHITAAREYLKQPPEIQKKVQLSPEGMKLLGVKEIDLVQTRLPGM